MRKGEIACNEQFLLFSQCFLTYMVLIFQVKLTLKCRLQFVSIWTSLKFCRLVISYTPYNHLVFFFNWIFQLAVLSKNVETVEILLNAGADPNAVDSGFRTPLTNVILEYVRNYEATKTIDPDVMTIIYMLVQAGTDLNFNKFVLVSNLSTFYADLPITR